MNLRAYYRIEFPLGDRPWFLVGDRLFPVLDCSERGLHVQVEEALRPEVDEPVRGTVRFPNGEEKTVEGFVLRHTPEGVAVALPGPGLSFGTMLRLQIYLRRRHWLAEWGPDAPDGPRRLRG